MNRDATTSSTYKWAVVAMLWMICFFNYADRQGIFSVFALLKDKEQGMGLSDVQLGYIGSAFMWVYAAVGWFAGMVGDRFRRKTVILSGFVFWSVITYLFGFATQYWHLVVLRAIEGLGEAFYFPAAMAMISAYHGKETRSRAMGIHQSSVYVGTIAGATVAGAMGEYCGWQSSFYVFGLCGMVVALILFALLKEPSLDQQAAARADMGAPRQRDSFGEMLKGILTIYKIPMVWVLTAVFVGANFVAMIFLVWLPTFLREKFDMSLTMAGFSATAYLQVGSILGVLVGGMLADWLVRRYRGGRPMTQSVGLFCGVPFIFLVGWTLQVPILVPAMAFFGFFKGIYDSNIWASLHDVVPPERRATAVGVMNSIGWFGGGLATVAIAAASQRFTWSVCISATSMIYLAFGVLLVWGIWMWMNGRTVQTLAPKR